MEPLEATDPRAAGPYQLIGRLGSGGMGRVFVGESVTGRRVAVKLVREDLAATPGFRDRFRREAKLAMRAGGFWTAPVVDADPDATMPWIASQYVDGPSLAEHVIQQGPLDEAEVRRLGTGLAEAIASFHRGGLVHRDLKPSNVLLVDDGPRVIDFGISKALETTGGTDLTKAGTVLGTPGFMSPEQALGQPVGPPSDVFSLGSLLVYAATGAGAFGDGSSHALLFRVVYEAPDLSAVPDGLRVLVQDCLHKSPEARPTADALLARLAGMPRATIPDPRIAPRAAAKTVSDADALAATGPQRASSTATAESPEPAPRGHRPVAEPPAALATFTVEKWGLAACRRRMRRPAASALTVAGFLLFVGVLAEGAPAAFALVFLAMLLHLLYGLKVSLPLLRPRALRVGADGLFVRHGPHTLTVPWRDISSVTLTGKRNRHSIALTAALREGTDTRVPSPLHAGTGVLKCTIVSAAKNETGTRLDGLDTALRHFAGSRYQSLPAAG
ncbi:serine/threonine-protein kinase [Streptomyces decoyicus]|uniref:serine/threonine-protein kinase n=1 Tax=Streptomyces decoyicus TaxID=249567 RepID=UPI002E170C4A|nr:serine/threonine protein kinase [Streptomyces decoyicus]